VLIFLFTVAVSLTACNLFSSKIQADDLMADISADKVNGKQADNHFISSTADFSIELFKQTISSEENTLISPLSVMIALAMTANGADNQTLTQMENVLGKDILLEDLNEYLFTYISSLPNEKKSKLTIVNSIWFRDDEGRLKVEKDFLQKNADYYKAAAYKSAFDSQTLKDINEWVKTNTDGMIDKILDEINVDAVMYLLNAIVFDAEWETVYNKTDIHKGDFTAFDGSKQTVEFMNSKEHFYLDDGKAVGFIKPYVNDAYSFLALLPNEDVPVEDYVAALSGSRFTEMIKNAERTTVTADLPKFSYEYSVSMNDALKNLGMPDAFSAKRADFRRLGQSARGNIFVYEVLHKTFINVDELGTKAGAVTKVEVHDESAALEMKYVRLDRPFIYSIIDNATGLPLFIGIVKSIV